MPYLAYPFKHFYDFFYFLFRRRFSSEFGKSFSFLKLSAAVNISVHISLQKTQYLNTFEFSQTLNILYSIALEVCTRSDRSRFCDRTSCIVVTFPATLPIPKSIVYRPSGSRLAKKQVFRSKEPRNNLMVY